MSESNDLDVNKKLSEKHALWEYDKLFAQEGANIVQAYRNMDRLLDLLKTAGFSQSAAITKMTQDAKKLGLKGFSEASIRRALPEESKKHTKPGPRKSNQMITSVREKNQVRLVVPEEPSIPPPPQVVKEVEIVREPPKPVNEPISIPQKIVKILFDPAPIDRDRTQVFIIHYDVSTNTIKKYETVGRRSIRT